MTIEMEMHQVDDDEALEVGVDGVDEALDYLSNLVVNDPDFDFNTAEDAEVLNALRGNDSHAESGITGTVPSSVSFCEEGFPSPEANSARASASPPPIPPANGGVVGTARALSSSCVSLSPSSSTLIRSISAVSTPSSMSTTTSQSRPWHNVDYRTRSWTSMEGMIANVWRDVREMIRLQSQTEYRSSDHLFMERVVAEYKREFYDVLRRIYEAVSEGNEEKMPRLGSNPSVLYKKLRLRKSEGRLEEIPSSPDGLRFFGKHGVESDGKALYDYIREDERRKRRVSRASSEDVEGDSKMPAYASTPKRQRNGSNDSGGSSTSMPASNRSCCEDSRLDKRLRDAMELFNRDERAQERHKEFSQLVIKLRAMNRSDLHCLTEQVLVEALEKLWPRPSNSPKSPPPHNPGDSAGSGSRPRSNGNDRSRSPPPPPPPPNQGDGSDGGSHPRGSGTSGNDGASGYSRSSGSRNHGDNPWSTGSGDTFGSDGDCDGQSPSGDRSFTGDRQEGDAECGSKKEKIEKLFLECARRGDLPVVQRCVHQGVDVNVRDSFGWTALHMASANGFSEIVQLLVDNDADIKAEVEDGLTPFDVAWTYEVSECLRLRLVTSNFLSGSMPNDMEASSGSSCSELTSTRLPGRLQMPPLSTCDTEFTDKLANLTISGSCRGLGNDVMKGLPESSLVAPSHDSEGARNKKTMEPESETALSWGYNEILDSDGLGDDEMRGLQESSQVAPSVDSEGGHNEKTMEHESESAQTCDPCPRSNNEISNFKSSLQKGHSASTCATAATMCSSTRSDLSQLGESSASLNDQPQDERPPLKRAIPMQRARRGLTITNEPNDASLAAADEE